MLLITLQMKASKCIKQLQVLQKFALLKQSYSSKTDLTMTRASFVPKLKEWHDVLFTDLLEKPSIVKPWDLRVPKEVIFLTWILIVLGDGFVSFMLAFQAYVISCGL